MQVQASESNTLSFLLSHSLLQEFDLISLNKWLDFFQSLVNGCLNLGTLVKF